MPEVFPKQAFVGKCGNWCRLPGKHHKREHWSQIWDGNYWLDGEAAVAWLLAIEGDSPDLIPAEATAQRPLPRRTPFRVRLNGGSLANLIAAYMRTLPSLSAGQGRDDVGFLFACFLVRDLALGDDVARDWLRLWEGNNNPPKGEAAITKWLASAHKYGQRPVGSGRCSSPDLPAVTPASRPGHSTLRCRVEVH